MYSNPKSPYAIAYLDKDFSHQEGRHQIEQLVLIGWLLCTHWSDETQARELWHIVNPELREAVDKTAVNKLISSLMYVAVNLNQKLVTAMPQSGEKEKALTYLAKCNKNRKNFANELTEGFGDEIT